MLKVTSLEKAYVFNGRLAYKFSLNRFAIFHKIGWLKMNEGFPDL
jgi:hypothetical protein